MNSDTLRVIYEFMPTKDKIIHLRTSKLFNNTFYNDAVIGIMRKATNKSKITDKNRKHILSQICKSDDATTLKYLCDQKLISFNDNTLKQILVFSAMHASVNILELYHNIFAQVYQYVNYNARTLKPYYRYFLVLLLHKKQYNIFNKIMTSFSISFNNLADYVVHVSAELDDADIINYFFSTGNSESLKIHTHCSSHTLKECCKNDKRDILSSLRNNKLVTDTVILSTAISVNNLSVAKWIYNFGNCVIDMSYLNAKRNAPIIIFTWMLSKCSNALSNWDYFFTESLLNKYLPPMAMTLSFALQNSSLIFKYMMYLSAFTFVGDMIYQISECKYNEKDELYFEIKNLMDYCDA